jgi:nitrate reductase gamma subunit
MDENALLDPGETMKVDDTWKMKTLFIGAALGALTGLGAAFLLTKRAEQKGTRLTITPGKGVQLGVMLAGLLRSILMLGED